MTNCHRAKHEKHLPDHDQYPRLEDMTFRKMDTKAGTEVQSQIDYLLASSPLIARMEHCYTDSRTSRWAPSTEPRKSYHLALVTTFDWKGLWLGEAPRGPGPKRLGGRIKPGPNYAALTPDRAKTIARLVNDSLKRRWKRLRACWGGKRSKQTIRDTLMNDLKSLILRVAKSVLGISKPKPPAAGKGARVEEDDAWRRLVQIVGAALNTTVDSFGKGPKADLEGTEVHAIRAKLALIGVELPTTRKDWLTWWLRRDFHHAEALMDREKLILTDKLAQTNPKRFYAQVTRPFSSSHIQALRKGDKIISTDEGIEDALHGYISGIAKDDQIEAPGPPEEAMSEGPGYRGKPKGLMAHMHMHELQKYLKSLDNTSFAGYDGISPALLKTVFMTTWDIEEPRTKEDKRRDGLSMAFSSYCEAKRHELSYKTGDPLPLKPGPQAEQTITTTCYVFSTSTWKRGMCR